MESIVLGIIVGVGMYLTYVPHVGQLFAVILGGVVCLLMSGAVTYIRGRTN